MSRHLPPPLNNISDTTEEEELVRNGEPGPGGARRQDESPDAPGVDDDRLRDHHIEEMLSTFKDAVRMRDRESGASEEGRD